MIEFRINREVGHESWLIFCPTLISSVMFPYRSRSLILATDPMLQKIKTEQQLSSPLIIFMDLKVAGTRNNSPADSIYSMEKKKFKSSMVHLFFLLNSQLASSSNHLKFYPLIDNSMPFERPRKLVLKQADYSPWAIRIPYWPFLGKWFELEWKCTEKFLKLLHWTVNLEIQFNIQLIEYSSWWFLITLMSWTILQVFHFDVWKILAF